MVSQKCPSRPSAEVIGIHRGSQAFRVESAGLIEDFANLHRAQQVRERAGMGFKIQCPQGREGSSPSFGTTLSRGLSRDWPSIHAVAGTRLSSRLSSGPGPRAQSAWMRGIGLRPSSWGACRRCGASLGGSRGPLRRKHESSIYVIVQKGPRDGGSCRLGLGDRYSQSRTPHVSLPYDRCLVRTGETGLDT